MSSNNYLIEARVTPPPKDGYERSGRDIPRFTIVAYSVTGAATTILGVLREANPDAAYVIVTAWNPDTEEYAVRDSRE